MDKNPHLLIHVQVFYYFDEIYIPLFKQFETSMRFSILIDSPDGNEAHQRLIKKCENFKCIKNIYVRRVSASNKIKALFSIRKLVQELDEVDLFIAGDLSSPEMQFLQHELYIRGTKSIFLQVAGLNHTAWEFYINATQAIVTPKKIDFSNSRIIQFGKYPRYLRHALNRFKSLLEQFLIRFFVGLIFHQKIYTTPKFRFLPYPSGNEGKIFLIYSPDKAVIEKMYGPRTTIVIEPPYMSTGYPEEEKNLLIAFPGPLDTDEQLANLQNFFDTIAEVKKYLDYEKIIVRWHPRESSEAIEVMMEQLRATLPGIDITDVSDQPLLDVLSSVKIFLGGVSNALAVARRTSKTRKVIGVKNAGLLGIMGTNIQYQMEPDILWVEGPGELDTQYLSRKEYRQLIDKNKTFQDAVAEVLKDS